MDLDNKTLILTSLRYRATRLLGSGQAFTPGHQYLRLYTQPPGKYMRYKHHPLCFVLSNLSI